MVVFGYRIYRIKSITGKLSDSKNLKLKLPIGFYIEQTIALFAISIFLLALDPVPAFYAVAAVFGIFADTILTAYYYSAKESVRLSGLANNHSGVFARKAGDFLVSQNYDNSPIDELKEPQ